MPSRLWWLLLVALLVTCGLAGIRSCRHSDASENVVPRAPSPSATGVKQAESEAEALELRERIRRHDDAVYAAIATLQRYLAALGDDDRSRADAFWAGKKPPTDTREADLRSLRDLRGLRIENGKPQALDSEAVPQSLEIPVELRVGFAHGPMRRYRGWYRLRRSVIDGQWEITSASIDVVERSH